LFTVLVSNSSKLSHKKQYEVVKVSKYIAHGLFSCSNSLSNFGYQCLKTLLILKIFHSKKTYLTEKLCMHSNIE
jgi:hypothetical protein